MAISSADLALLRGNKHTVNPCVAAWPQKIVGTALLNQTSFSYPLGQLTVDNQTAGWSDILVGQRYVIREGDGDFVTSGIVRKVPAGNTFYIDGKSLGDPGRPERIASHLQNNQVVTVYEDWPLVTLLSRISGQVFYKRFDVAYTDEGSNPAPVVNLGEWQYADVALGASATFSMTATAACWASKTVSSYAWTLPSGASYVGGTTSTDQAIQFTMPGGFGVVTCTVTDSGGASKLAVRPVWVREPSGVNEPFSHSFPCAVDSDSQDLQGRNLTLTPVGEANLQEAVVYPGQAFMVRGRDLYAGSEASAVVSHFVGFAGTGEHDSTRFSTRLALDLQGPFAVLGAIPMVPQMIREVASPAQWTEVSNGLADLNFVLWYVLEHHCPNMLTLFDFHMASPTPPKRTTYALNGNSVTAQLQGVAADIAANIGCASDGSLYFLRDPNLEDNTFRNALDERCTIGAGDIVGNLSYPANYRAPIGQLKVYAFMLDASSNPVPLGSVAPGKAQGQGVGRIQGDALLVSDQDDLNEKSGHLLAQENAPTPEVTVQMDRNFDVFDPARDFQRWYRLTIPAQYNPRGETVDWRTLVTQVNRTWRNTDAGTPIKELSVTLQPETYGQPGVTIPILQGNAANSNPNAGATYNKPEMFFDQRAMRAFAMAWTGNADLGATGNIGDALPVWGDIQGPWSGNVNDLAFDYSSPFVSSGFVEGALGAWAVVTSGTSFEIWYTADVLATGTLLWTQQASYTMGDNTCVTSARIAHSDTTLNTLAAAWREQSGTYVVWTTNGSTWSGSAVKVDEATDSDTGNDDAPFGLAMDGNNAITTGRRTNGTTAYSLYYSASPGSAFSYVPNGPTASLAPIGTIKFDSDLVYCSVVTPYTYRQADQNSTAYSVTVSRTLAQLHTLNSMPDDGRDVWGAYIEYADGSGGSPRTFPPGTLQLRVQVDLDSPATIAAFRFQVLAEDTEVFFNTFDVELRAYNASSVLLYTFTDAACTLTRLTGNVFVAVPGTPIASVDHFTIYVDNASTVSLTLTPGSTELDIGIRDIAAGPDTAILYKVAAYAGTAVWTDISPASDRAPQYPGALAFDPVYPGRIAALGLSGDGASQGMYETIDGGSSWSSHGAVSTNLHGLMFIEDVVLSWGVGALDLTLSGLANVPGDSQLGNWADALGAVGTVLGVEALL